MALAVLNVESLFLKGNTEICVILPDLPKQQVPKDFYESGRKFKVMWLLHGGGGDSSDWIRKSNIELYASENELAIVTISGCNATYANWGTFANGMDYPSLFFKELMPMIYGWFPISERKEDNLIAGLSMGAAGALKYAITNPERFTGCICLSSCGKNSAWIMKLMKTGCHHPKFSSIMRSSMRAESASSIVPQRISVINWKNGRRMERWTGCLLFT